MLNYRNKHGRQRRLTIGAYPGWKTKVARKEASDIRRQIDIGNDPMAGIEQARGGRQWQICASVFKMNISQNCIRQQQMIIAGRKYYGISSVKAWLAKQKK
ncbi:MAG: DUF4102 domain-containing protein [Hyphomicrobiales bacterium]|nr:DUF4102 domain-containing protein [Hyphomicrobiales bacterium]